MIREFGKHLRGRETMAALACASLLWVSGCGSEDSSTGLIGQPVLTSITINEVFAENSDRAVTFSFLVADGHGEYDPWIELYNAGSEDAPLGGYWMSRKSLEPATELPDQVVVPAGGVYLLWADETPSQTTDDEVHLGFTLGSSDVESVVLFGPEKQWLDQMRIQPAEQPVSWGRYPDGSDNVTECGVPTPGELNGDDC